MSVPHPLCSGWSGRSYLEPYAEWIMRRQRQAQAMEQRLTGGTMTLDDFAAGHEYFGLHRHGAEWVLREWAPNASAIRLTGTFTNWSDDPALSLHRLNDDGVWELRLPSAALAHGDLYRLRMYWKDAAAIACPLMPGAWSRTSAPRFLMPSLGACSRLTTGTILSAGRPRRPWFTRRTSAWPRKKARSAATGSSRTKSCPASWRPATTRCSSWPSGTSLLRIIRLSRDEFLCASSRFGTPEELKELVDAAHAAGLTVIMDLIHSHSARNEVEGLSRFDGTLYQFFHDGPRGVHELWDSRCFDYGKPQVLHFLLSNCRFWLDEFRFDGFRFDGITSMLYSHHGLGKAFTSYADYFNSTVDEQALTYLTLANNVIHAVRPDAMTVPKTSAACRVWPRPRARRRGV